MSEASRDESKIGLILSQLAGVRARRNLLAVQHWLFCTLATLVVAATLVLIAALKFSPLTFLLATAIAAVLAIVILVRVIRSALHMSSNMLSAAALADERAQLKDRLTTVATIAPQKRRSGLWDYLIEDVFSLREDFTPSKVEPRRVERSVFAFLAACVIALLMLRVMASRHPVRIAANGMMPPGQITADINNLVIRPADPALEPNARIFADQETLRALEEKLAQSEKAHRRDGPMSKLMDRARNFADAFQNKLTGDLNSHMPPITMRLTDKKHGGAKGATPEAGSSKGNGGGGLKHPGADSENQMAQGKQALPPLDSLAPNQADQLAENDHSGTPGYQGQQGNRNSPNNSSNPALQQGQGGSGSSHGSGADPGSLFGKPSNQPLGSDSFKIAIDAQPSDESSSRGSAAYVPPKVHVPLNSTQYPDEPLARTSVPASDQMTIKRVFQR